MIKEILFVLLIFITAFLTGYLLAWLCKDELKQGRKWFKILSLSSIILSFVFIFFDSKISLTFLFMAIVTFISLKKSYDKKFIK